MATVTFDTLGAKQILADAGVEDKHATAFVDVAHKSASENVATKDDIADVKVNITNLKVDIARVETRLTIELAAVAGIIIAAFKFFGN